MTSQHAQLWPADHVERRPVDQLIPYAHNARTHSEAQIAQLAASIREWGWTVPVLVDEDSTLIAGHGRVLAARKLGLMDVPVMVACGWSEAQKQAYVLADNKLALNAGWDVDLLKVNLTDLREMGADLNLIGFGEAELAELFADQSIGLTDPDRVPALTAEAVSALGDVWALGPHRLVCGDCTNATVVAMALDSVAPHLMVTDPPYGVAYDANWRNVAARTSKGMGNRAIGAGAVGKVLNDDRADWREAWALFPSDVAYVWHAGLYAGAVLESLVATGFEPRAQINWAKSNFAIGRGHYHWQHEPAWYAVREKGHWVGDRGQTTLWEIPKPQKSETGHSTQKPVECMRRPIVNNSSPGQAVYEPFAGSGTTIIAAEMTGRVCHAIELNPAYVDVAVRRWQAFTGKEGQLASSGATFDDIGEQRGGPRSETSTPQESDDGAARPQT